MYVAFVSGILCKDYASFTLSILLTVFIIKNINTECPQAGPKFN